MRPGSHQKTIKSQECGGKTHDTADFCHTEKRGKLFFAEEGIHFHLKWVKRKIAQFVAQEQQESGSTMGLRP
jgi:hypothetical protein